MHNIYSVNICLILAIKLGTNVVQIFHGCARTAAQLSLNTPYRIRYVLSPEFSSPGHPISDAW